MLRAYAGAYLAIGSVLARMQVHIQERPDIWARLDEGAKENILSCLATISGHCESLSLRTSVCLITQLSDDLRRGLCGSLGLPSRIDGVDRALKAEINSRLFLVIPEDRVQFWVSPAHDECGTEVAGLIGVIDGPFSDASYDLREAANCFACERYTASVYHQMRVAEYGLVAVADSINLADEDKYSWERMLQGIQKHIKTIESTKPTGWDSDRKKYSDLCNWFTTLKTGWRNPASHVPRIYQQATARAMFQTLRGLFQHLEGYCITQVQMPRSIAKPEEDVA